jgi:1A family penicillin-binding protein
MKKTKIKLPTQLTRLKHTYHRLHRLTPRQFIHSYKKQLLIGLVCFFLILLLIPVATYLYFIQDIKDKDSIMNRNNTGLTLLDRNGEKFFTFNQPKEINYVPLSNIPVPLQQAVIATEDKNFYTNPGVSLRGIARAFLTNLTAGRIVEGGSTITQELVKNALLNSSRNYLRKFQEALLAYELNRRYSKQDILEMYLNSVYFGEGAFGIENAAQTYFSKHARDLTLAESALLAGLLPAPSYYSPLSNDPDRALHKQKTVLAEMVEEKYITRDQADQTGKQTIKYHPLQKEQNTLAPHFALYVKDQLVQKYGEEKVLRSGLVVTTTLNSTWQKYAEKTVQNQIQYLKYNKASNAAAVAIDPKTGQILVMVGSENWDDEAHGKTNMALIPRQPGSSFKPIVYALALEKKLITPATILQDNKTIFPGGYEPHNYDKQFRGPVTVRRSLANSLNIPSVQIMNQVGVESVLQFAQKLGITTLKDPSKYGLSLVLGAGEVPLLQMTDAYAAFADQGTYNPIVAVLEVKDKHAQVIDKYQPHPQTVLSQATAFLISSILSDNLARAEVFGSALTISRPAAVKTGTTENYRDALTIGYTPGLVIGVWVGNNDNAAMDNIAGSLGAAPIWRALMQNFLTGTPIEQFKPPASVVALTVCPYLGQSDTPLASAAAIKEFFFAGTQPQHPCTSPTPTTADTTTPTATPTNQPTAAPQQPTSTPQPATNTPVQQPAVTATPQPTQVQILPSPTLQILP